MKSFFAIICFLGIILNCVAQDLIVTNEGDSINCKITKVKPDNIYFTFKYKDEFRSTLLPVSNVSIYLFKYYTTSVVPSDKVIGHENYKHIRLALNMGYSYQTYKIDQNQNQAFINYLKKLKSGYNFGGSFTYFFTEFIGCGLDYKRFMTSNSLDNIYITDKNGNRQYGKMADDIRISILGPSITSRFTNPNKTNALLLTYSFGYLDYRNNAVLINKFTMTGSTLGMCLDIGYDIGISKSLQFGFQLSLISGQLTKYRLNDGHTTQIIQLDKENYENLYRVDLSVGLRFNK